jgi:solute carrier family 35 protein F1/2
MLLGLKPCHMCDPITCFSTVHFLTSGPILHVALLLQAYQYTSLTSIQILDCFTIVFVMALARVVIGTRYSRAHVLGAAVCILGMGGIIAADARASGNSSATGSSKGTHSALGDGLVLVATFLYASSNISEEFIVKRRGDRVEFLGMLGLFGTGISGVQALSLERDAFKDIVWSECRWLLFGYIVCLFTMHGARVSTEVCSRV